MAVLVNFPGVFTVACEIPLRDWGRDRCVRRIIGQEGRTDLVVVAVAAFVASFCL